MIIFPAVDIKGGQCVRLKKGRADQETVFASDPVQAALHWQNQGAEWLHLVDLDGAFAGSPVNLSLIARLCAATATPLHLVEPLGFKLTDRYLKRAGLDYWPHVNLTVWEDFESFRAARPGR